MKSSITFGVGLVSGAIITSSLLVSLPRDQPAKEVELATLRADLSHAQKAAQHDREALRSALQERKVLRDVAPSNPASPIAAPEASTVSFWLTPALLDGFFRDGLGPDSVTSSGGLAWLRFWEGFRFAFLIGASILLFGLWCILPRRRITDEHTNT